MAAVIIDLEGIKEGLEGQQDNRHTLLDKLYKKLQGLRDTKLNSKRRFYFGARDHNPAALAQL